MKAKNVVGIIGGFLWVFVFATEKNTFEKVTFQRTLKSTIVFLSTTKKK
jgi:hypothetical protein